MTVMNNYTLRLFHQSDAEELFALLTREGEEWKDYWWGAEAQAKYLNALVSEPSYVIFDGNTLAGYMRCMTTHGYGVVVWDLLIDKAHRGKEYGLHLMEQVKADYPDQPIYIMSDADPYYEKLGYKVEGTIFTIP